MTSVYVGNLAYGTTEDNLIAHFSPVGTLIKATIPHRNGRSAGWGTVEFQDPAHAQASIEKLNSSTLDGRTIYVKLDEPREARPPRTLAPREPRAPRAERPPVDREAQPSSSRPPRDPSTPTHKLFVGNLPWSVSWQDLKDMFKPYGEVLFSRVVTDRATGRSRGFGTIEFGSAEQAQKAIEGLNGYEIAGRNIVVKFDERP